MSRLIGLRGFLFVTIAVVCALSGRTTAAEPLRLVTDFYLGPYEHIADDKAPGFLIEVLRQVFAAMGHDVSFEGFPTNRSWMMIASGERDGIFGVWRNSERERICLFPDEPFGQEKWVFFIRAEDVGKLKFSSFEDLVGHDVAVREPVPGLFEQPTVSPELWKFLREHRNLVETNGVAVSLRMLAAGRVDYAVVSLVFGKYEVARIGLSERIEPLVSRSAFEQNVYVCFTKRRVDPAFVNAFSRALKEFKQTEAYQAIYRKYFS